MAGPIPVELEWRIVLVGKTGNGKSATGNTILGKEAFKATMSPNSVTKYCQKGEVEWNGRKIVVVDTPGFFDTGVPGLDTAAEVKKCVSLCRPGPHVILQVRYPCPFTEEEKDVAQLITDIFSLKAKDYMIFLFTRKEDLEGRSLEDFLSEGGAELENQMAHCGNRFLAFNNKAEGEEQEAQLAELMAMIDELVKKNEGAPCYTEDMLEKDKKEFEGKKVEMKEEMEEKKRSWRCPLF